MARFTLVALITTSSCVLFPSLDGLSTSDGGSVADGGGHDATFLPDASNPNDAAQASDVEAGKTTYLRTITIHNNATQALPQGYTIGVPFPASQIQAAISASKMRSDLNDLRVHGSSGERDRLVDAAPLASVIWFSLSSPISSGATDMTYAITYGVPSASSPPAAGANVFNFYDDFGGAALDTSKWQKQGTVNVNGGMMTMPHGGLGALTTIAQGPLSTVEWRAQISDPSSSPDGNTGFYYWFGFQHTGDFVENDPWILWIARASGSVGAEDEADGCPNNCANTPQTQTTAFRSYGIERQSSATIFSIDGSQAWSTPATNDQALSLMIRNYLVTSDLVVDWIRSRTRIYPEPTVTLGGEQLQ